MSEKSYFDSKLAEFAKWDLKTIKKFRRYISEYELVPSYKKVLNSMIRFSDMYRPIIKGSLFLDIYGTVTSANEYRSMMRSKIYMNKRDIINTFDKKSGRRLVVTSRGHKIYYKSYPLAQLRERKWDEKWTIIAYDFPISRNKLRDYFREKLKKFGFGSPQYSILITPLPLQKTVRELIEGEKLEYYAWVLRAKSVLGLSNLEIARKSWPIDELNNLYKKLDRVLVKIKRLKQKNKKRELIDEWKHYFLATNSSDPYLPEELLPEGWEGIKCERKFIKLGPKGFLKSLFEKLL